MREVADKSRSTDGHAQYRLSHSQSRSGQRDRCRDRSRSSSVGRVRSVTASA